MNPVIGVAFPEQMNSNYRPWVVNYMKSLKLSGAIPIGLPINFDPELIERQLDLVSGVMLTGGVDIDPEYYGEKKTRSGDPSPERDEFEALLVPAVLKRDLPLFGICRGIQSLNVFSGGDLFQHVDGPDSCEHGLDVLGGRLASIIGQPHIKVNSFHHQAVRKPAPGFVVTGRSDQGITEAIEQPDASFVLAVQWHPERSFDDDEYSRRLFSAFVGACAGNKQ